VDLKTSPLEKRWVDFSEKGHADERKWESGNQLRQSSRDLRRWQVAAVVRQCSGLMIVVGCFVLITGMLCLALRQNQNSIPTFR
jgi:hypothetical protein